MLRFSELRGMGLMTTEGPAGKIEDILFDDRTWQVRYLAVDANGWMPGGKVILAPDCFLEKPVRGGLFHIRLGKEQLERSPSIHEDLPVSRQYEEEVHRFYNWNPYWLSPHA